MPVRTGSARRGAARYAGGVTDRNPPAEARRTPERPRDELGRPLPRGARNRLVLEHFDALSVDENHRLGIDHFNAGRFFEAHEAWETAWRQTKGTDDEEFFKGLSQLGAGYTHYRRENVHGAQALMHRAIGRIAAYGPAHRSVDIEALVRASSAHAARLRAAEESGGDLPGLEPPRI